MEHEDKVASLTHSAKNRLQLLQPLLEVLNDHPDEVVQDTGKHISRQLDEVNQQLVLMLSLYRMEHTNLVSAEPIEVMGVFSDLLDNVSDSRVRVDPDRTDPNLEVYGDERLIKAVIGDAIHNALRHCQNEVLLSVEKSKQGALIRVRDDGQPNSDISSKNQASEGSGVGLWIANRIAEAHRNGTSVGYARHSFSADDGSCFELFLP